MDTHYVDQYIRNKRRGDSTTSGAGGGGDSHLTYQPVTSSTTTTTSANTTSAGPGAAATSTRTPYQPQSHHSHHHHVGGTANHQFGASPHYNRPQSSSGVVGGGMINHAAHQVLLSAAARAQQEVDAVSSAAADLALREEQAERVERQYALLSERVDTTSLQVASAEDKVINVTKMLKMLQQLSEDREKSLRDDTGELRTKIKRLERQLEQERESREKMSEASMQYVRDTVDRALEKQMLSIRGDFQRQIDALDATVRASSRTTEELRSDVDEVRRVADKFGSVLREVEQFCSRFADDTRSSTRTLVESRLEEFRIRNDGQAQKVEDLREKVEDVHDRLTEAITSQHELRRSLEDIKRRSDPLREWVEDRVAVFKSEVRESVQKENEKITSQLHVSLANASAVMENNENNISDLRAELEKLASTMHKHVTSVESNNERQAESFQDLRELSQQNRDLLVQQLEATKDWASRNILRLKKHLDLAVSDMAATRQAQLEMQVNFQKLTQAHNDEKAVLLRKLAQKEREVSCLSQAVDREVHDVADMLHRYDESRQHAQMQRQARDELRALSTMP